MARQETVETLEARLAWERRLVQLIDRVHAARSLDAIFLELQGAILALLDAERMTLYAVDPERGELYSKFLALDTVKEIRVPIGSGSLAGFAAAARRAVSVRDAYDRAELAAIAPGLTFDASWDRKTRFRTRQVLAVPIVHETGGLVGLIQLLNKKNGARFTAEDEAAVERVAGTLAIAFHNQQQWSQRRPGKFDTLLAQHRITQEELAAAIAEARRRQTDVESVLIEQYRVPRAEVGQALAAYYHCPYVAFDERVIPPPELMRELKLEFLKANLWLPLRRDAEGVLVVIDNPHDLQRVDAIGQALPRERVHLAVGLRADIVRYLAMASGDGAGADSIASLIGELKAEEAPERAEEAAGGEVDENDSAIIRLANQIIVDAYKARASDVHVEPYGAQQDTVIRYRVDGTCLEYQRIPGAWRRALVARLKIMAQLDIAERRKPQDGKIRFRLPEREIELRVATVPTAGANEDVVMRILAASEPIPLDGLGMTERNLRELTAIAAKPYGLILCVGPTGSGKTTTLHSVLGHINTPERKIWTAEDPVEITQYGLRQVQVNPKIAFTFASAMRAFLRADPDVIMVGEMRDAETAATGIEASLTGHLVLSTLHTNSAAETVVRLLDMGLDPFNFADALLGILAQRLVKRICEACRETYRPERSEFDELVHGYGETGLARLGVTWGDDVRLYRGKGCGNCNNTGYRGRAAIHELLIASDEVKRLVQSRARVPDLLAQAKAEGMTTLVQDGVAKCFAGVTDFRQVKAVAIR